jgi:hypothetical protein
MSGLRFIWTATGPEQIASKSYRKRRDERRIVLMALEFQVGAPRNIERKDTWVSWIGSVGLFPQAMNIPIAFLLPVNQ